MGIYLNPSKPLIVENTILLDAGYIGIFYCPYHEWHDIGAIYNTEKQFQGYYCDICTPIQKVTNGYTMTDFFLDLWISPDNRYLVLDEDEFTHAITQAWLSSDQILKAKNELSTLITTIQAQRFPAMDIKQLLTLPENINNIINALRIQRKENV